jgi:hypothetical protein
MPRAGLPRPHRSATAIAAPSNCDAASPTCAHMRALSLVPQFVLTASEKDGMWEWGPLAWGGKGKAAGQFQTAHGIFAHAGHIFVANREAHQVGHLT